MSAKLKARAVGARRRVRRRRRDRGSRLVARIFEIGIAGDEVPLLMGGNFCG